MLLTNPLHRNAIIEEKQLDCKLVTEEQFTDFITRFSLIYITPKNNVFSTYKEHLNCNSYFCRGIAITDKINIIGHLDNDSIVSDMARGVVAKNVGTVSTYHYYNTESMFAGVIGEIILQLPIEINKSNKTYYYSYEKTGFDLGYHTCTISFYEKY